MSELVRLSDPLQVEGLAVRGAIGGAIETDRGAGKAVLVTPARPLPAWRLKLCLVVADLAAVAVTLLFAYLMRVRLPGSDPREAASYHALLGLMALPIWIAFLAHYHLYSARHVQRPLHEFARIFHAAGMSVAATALLAFMLQWGYVARGWLVLSFLFGVLALVIERAVARRWFDRLRRTGRLSRPVIVVGANDEAHAICRSLIDNPKLGYRVVGYIDDGSIPGTVLSDDLPVLGRVEDTVDVVRQTGAVGVVIVGSALNSVVTNALIRRLNDSGIHVELSSSLRNVAPERLTVTSLAHFPVVYVEPVRLAGWRMVAKRAFDFTVAAVGLVVFAPVFLVAAVAIKLDSQGPVLFRQERIGKQSRTFRMLKLRSMVHNAHDLRRGLANEADGPLFKVRNDPRVTRVGRFLRSTSLDELPQLWNVLCGHMSLVGPRPALVEEVRGWTPELHERLRVRPGMTGMWQVSCRSAARFEEYVRLDLYYVDNWSLVMDIAILAKTIPSVLFRRGAC